MEIHRLRLAIREWLPEGLVLRGPIDEVDVLMIAGLGAATLLVCRKPILVVLRIRLGRVDRGS